MKRSFIIALAIIGITCALTSCDSLVGGNTNNNEDPQLSGSITISPNSGVTTGTPLTAAYSGSENVSYQWNKDGTPISGETGAAYTPAEAGSYTVTVSAAGYQSKTSAPVTVTGTGASLFTSQFTGSYTASNKTIIFSDKEWVVKVNGTWHAGGIYTPSGNTATLKIGGGAGLGSAAEGGGTAILSNNGNTLTVSGNNDAAINGTYVKQDIGAFRIKITGIPQAIMDDINTGDSSSVSVSISRPGIMGAGRDAKHSDPYWEDTIGTDSYECWIYDPDAERVYYFGPPGDYEVKFTASDLSIFKYKSAVPLKINELNTIAYDSFDELTVKTLVMTNISGELKTAGQDGFVVGVVQEGTAPDQAMAQIGVIAGADGDDIVISGSNPYTATIHLPADWTGITACDIYIVLGSGGSRSYYRATGVSCSESTINVDAETDFEPITP